jgi:hypothetical protein
MSKALVLGAAALTLSAGASSAQVPGYDYNGATVPLYGYAAPVADLAAPDYGYDNGGYGYGAPAYGYAAPAYAAPAPGYGYAAPAYAAPPTPGYGSSTVIIVAPSPAYTAAPPVASGYYGAGVVSQPIYDYAPGYWGGRGYWRRW